MQCLQEKRSANYYFYSVGSIACLTEKFEFLAAYHSELSSNFIENEERFSYHFFVIAVLMSCGNSHNFKCYIIVLKLTKCLYQETKAGA